MNRKQKRALNKAKREAEKLNEVSADLVGHLLKKQLKYAKGCKLQCRNWS